MHTSVLLSSRDEALAYPSADLRLALCEGCGLVTNTAFDARAHDYSKSYLEVQTFSPRFRSYLADLARTLVERHSLRGRPVVEIGCGRGDFLLELCALTRAPGYGVDPSFAEERLEGPGSRFVTVEREFFAPHHIPQRAAAVVCRHTLEHIADVEAFLARVREGVERAPGVVLVFEVPDARRIYEDGAFWDVFYEHCSYFTAGSLARTFRAAGLRPARLERVFGDQYLLLTATATPDRGDTTPLALEESAQEAVAAAKRFARSVEEQRRRWRDILDDRRERGDVVVIWGAGSKGVGFLTMLGVSEQVACAVDVNPAKHGMFMPGTGHEIVAPGRLREIRPSLVVVMNPAYREEIEIELGNLGVRTSVVAL